VTQPSLASQHDLVEHDPLDWPSGLHRSALWYTHTALQFGLLRVALGLCDGGMLTLAYSLGTSGIPVAHRASAFGVLHSGAQIGSAAHTPWNPSVPLPGAGQRPR
jgi:MFS family permease